ncbi:MFS transporter [Streptomyces sp. NPDC127049]|uniref:MFS transporter n=1 Tax=unclassified Streptomyces TaxID=2593676 RepID=UPI003648BAEB
MKRPLHHTFQSLTVRNFRLFTAGQLVSVTGTWMMVVAQDWLVLSRTGNSATALGVVTALQFAPLILLTLWAGGLADRYDKRRLLMAANLASGALALGLAALVLAGDVRLWQIYLFALGLGTVNAVEVPARMSFVSELVGPELVPNASALSAVYFNVARVVGPGVAGLLISRVDTGPVMLVNAFSYLATWVGLRLIRPAELHRAARRPARAPVGEGIRHVLSRRDLALPMALVAVVGMFGFNFQLTLPLLAKVVFHADAAAFGLLTTALAAGSLVAAFVTTGRRTRPGLGHVVAAAAGFGVVEALAALAPGFGAAAALLFLTGFGSIYFSQAANHCVQLGADPAYRGRVMALFTLVFQGTTPFGALLVGALAESHGARSGLLLGGVASALAAAVVLGVHRTLPPGVSPEPGAAVPDPAGGDPRGAQASADRAP